MRTRRSGLPHICELIGEEAAGGGVEERSLRDRRMGRAGYNEEKDGEDEGKEGEKEEEEVDGDKQIKSRIRAKPNSQGSHI